MLERSTSFGRIQFSELEVTVLSWMTVVQCLLTWKVATISWLPCRKMLTSSWKASKVSFESCLMECTNGIRSPISIRDHIVVGIYLIGAVEVRVAMCGWRRGKNTVLPNSLWDGKRNDKYNPENIDYEDSSCHFDAIGCIRDMQILSKEFCAGVTESWHLGISLPQYSIPKCGFNASYRVD